MNPRSTESASPAELVPRAGRLRDFSRGLSLVGVLACLALAWWWLATHHFMGEPTEVPPEAAGRPEAPADLVTLPETVKVGLVPVKAQPLQDELTVPGRLDYDARKQVDYRAPVEGIVTSVDIAVRQRVEVGTLLAELSSREVGVARDEVSKREADERIAADAAEWASTIAENVAALLEALESHPLPEQVQAAFANRPLGEERDHILGAYSALVHAEKVNAGTRSLSQGGLLSGRIVEERQANLEAAEAKFRAICEEARFTTGRARKQAESDRQQAERQLEIAREHLRALVGIGSPQRLDPESETGPVHDDDTLSTLDLRSPIAGMVEEVFVARGERVTSGQRLFVVADTSTLWVRAQIHERQWASVDVSPGQEVRVLVPGMEKRDVVAGINHVGSVVEEESRSVPLVAELANDDARYKPGMFVWVELPQGPFRERLVVPTEAVMRHEGRTFVFVAAGPGRFARREIRTGIETRQLVEVLEGLAAGETVVAEGAFVLKSRLLIEQEGGE